MTLPEPDDVRAAKKMAAYMVLRNLIAYLPTDGDVADVCRDLYLFEEAGGNARKADVLESLDRLIAQDGETL